MITQDDIKVKNEVTQMDNVTNCDFNYYRKPISKEDSFKGNYCDLYFEDDTLDKVLSLVGQKIETELNNQNLSVAKLSDMSGVNAGSLSRATRGEAMNFTLRNLYRIAFALGLNVSDICPVIFPRQMSYGMKYDALTANLDFEEKQNVFKLISDYISVLNTVKFKSRHP